jgi:hypothetical protein
MKDMRFHCVSYVIICGYRQLLLQRGARGVFQLKNASRGRIGLCCITGRCLLVVSANYANLLSSLIKQVDSGSDLRDL